MSGSIPTQPVGQSQASNTGQNPTGQGTAGQGSAGQNARLLQLPSGQTPLQTGQSLSGTTLPPPAQGQIALQTANGQLILQSPVSIPVGTQVTVQVLSGGNNPQLSVQIPGQQSTAQTGSGTAGTPQTGQSAPAAVSSVVAPGANIAARVTAPPTQQPGGQSSLVTPQTATAGAAGQTASQPGAPPAVPGATAAQPVPLPTGSSVSVQVVSITPPGAQSATITGGNPALHGIVTGATADGRPVVETAAGRLTLETRSAVPEGTRLELTVSSAPRAAAQTAQQPLSLLNQWQNLEQALQSLQSNNPAAARALAANLPQPGPQLSASLMFFLSAISTGDIRRILGDQANRALRGSGDVLQRLQDDVRQLQGMSVDRPGQEWRSFMIPLLSDAGMEQIRLFIRQKEDEEKKKKADDPATRFIVEVLLKDLGQVQFDGLARTKKLDLLIRSQTAVPQEMRAGITGVYSNTLSALGFSGSLAFQKVAEFPVNPMETSGFAGKGFVV